MKKRARNLLVGCGIAGALALACFLSLIWYAGSKIEESTRPVEDLDRYGDIIGLWDTNLVAHFPETPPEDAKFHYQPGFLQGGSSIQLTVILDEDALTIVSDQFEKKSIANYRLDETPPKGGAVEGMPPPGLVVKDVANAGASDFRLFVFDAKATGGTNFNWNHGYAYGAAADTKTGMLVYWAELW